MSEPQICPRCNVVHADQSKCKRPAELLPLWAKIFYGVTFVATVVFSVYVMLGYFPVVANIAGGLFILVAGWLFAGTVISYFAFERMHKGQVYK